MLRYYDSKYTLRNPNFNDEMKREMIEKLKANGGFGYVE